MVYNQSVQHSHDHCCLAGRKSGIWLGSADVQLGNIQQQWNQYKVSVLNRQKVSLYPDAWLILLSRSASSLSLVFTHILSFKQVAPR